MAASSRMSRTFARQSPRSRIATIVIGVLKNWASCHPTKPVRLMPCERPPELQNRVQTIRAGTARIKVLDPEASLGGIWQNERPTLRCLVAEFDASRIPVMPTHHPGVGNWRGPGDCPQMPDETGIHEIQAPVLGVNPVAGHVSHDDLLRTVRGSLRRELPHRW